MTCAPPCTVTCRKCHCVSSPIPRSGEIVSRFNNDVVGAQNAVTGTIPNIVTNVVTLLSTLTVMIMIEWRLALMSVAVLPLFLLPTRRVARVLRDIRREAMEGSADMSSIINETLTINGSILVKTFGRQQKEQADFGKAAGVVRDVGIRRAQVGQLFFVGLSIASTIGTALIYWAGGYMVLNDVITIGTIVAFVAYLARLYGPISALSNVQVDFATSMVSFERVFEYLDMPVEIRDKPDARPLRDVEGHIRFDHVTFSYREEDGLDGEGKSGSEPAQDEIRDINDRSRTAADNVDHANGDGSAGDREVDDPTVHRPSRCTRWRM